MHGTDLCNIHLRPPRGPRKTKLTEQLQDSLVAMLRAGNYVKVACQAVGLPVPTYDEWMRRGRDGEPRFAPFAQAIEEARAMGEVRNVAVISAAAPENWQAAAWILERSYPERWARLSQREKAEPEPQEKPQDPFAEADEIAQRRLQKGLT